jgi:DNA-binding response OmpR family regulator
VKRPSVLVVDDEPTVLRALRVALEAQDYLVTAVLTGEDALARVTNGAIDLVLLDLGLPGMSGFDVIRRVRVLFPALPIIVLSAQGEDAPKVEALDLGADDYVAKPFSPNELVARLRAMLRRPRRPGRSVPYGGEAQVRTFGKLTIDNGSREVFLSGERVDLTRIEFDLLAALCQRPRQVCSRGQLLETVWGPNWYGDTHVVDVHMSNLRRKLGDRDRSIRVIQTVRGVGFRLSDDAVKGVAV